MIKRVNIYALYKGDKNLIDGTIKELANYLNVKEKTIQFYNSNVYKNKRIKYYNNRLVVCYIGKEFKDV